MDFRGLDLNLLVALDVLLEEKSITRTGQRIYLSQSATSGVLARLRYFFQDELLVSSGHRMILTPTAERLIWPIKDFLRSAEAVIDRSPKFEPATSVRKYTLVMSDHVATILMPHVVRYLGRVAPSIMLELLPFTESPREDLEQGDTDFLIMPEGFLAEGHPSERLFSDEYACVVWAENSLYGENISLEQYLQAGHVAVRFGKQRLQSIDDWFLRTEGHARKVELIATSFNLVPSLLTGTLRVATLQRRLAQYHATHFPLRILDMPLSMPPLVESLQWHVSRSEDPGTQWMRNALREAAAEIAPLTR
jgi:DNA-binding transcriptional LysR family regulator